MVHLTRIYTRGGDKGKTSLGSGERVSKSDARINAIGDVDEANAAIGWVREYTPKTIDPLLMRIQNDLFDLGADLCVPKGKPDSLRIVDCQVDYLEKKIDDLNQHLEPLTSFILPGGSKSSAALHLARTIVRRAERSLIHLHQIQPINFEAIKYLNRLSDLLFVLCRHVNGNGKEDVLWVPGKSRTE
ncbi:MAG: cob(I)yrinic acid a,c-diamide adenosyltransferase [Alphaproteobacteria bacterium]|jgi:cob(I)alamin adenosyltransferase|nr:cob(I)yrinic acid a,c-diamide adenosyltransferase [Alphaproteobacteria bacterium]